jgi:hypothetical protein
VSRSKKWPANEPCGNFWTGSGVKLSASGFWIDWCFVTAIQRKQRHDELLKLRADDPLVVIDLYRRVVGLNRFSMLPGGMDYGSLIDSILDFEAARGRPLGFSKAV